MIVLAQYSVTRIGPIGLVEQFDGAKRIILFRGPYKEAQRIYNEYLQKQPNLTVPEQMQETH